MKRFLFNSRRGFSHGLLKRQQQQQQQPEEKIPKSFSIFTTIAKTMAWTLILTPPAILSLYELPQTRPQIFKLLPYSNIVIPPALDDKEREYNLLYGLCLGWVYLKEAVGKEVSGEEVQLKAMMKKKETFREEEVFKGFMKKKKTVEEKSEKVNKVEDEKPKDLKELIEKLEILKEKKTEPAEEKKNPESMELKEPVKPVEPVKSEESLKPEEQVKTTNPVKIEEPVKKEESVNSNKPVEPMKSVEPVTERVKSDSNDQVDLIDQLKKENENLLNSLLELKNYHQIQLDALTESFASFYNAYNAIQLQAQNEKHLQQQAEALLNQKKKLVKEFKRVVQEKVEEERQGRLSKLENVILKMKQLEQEFSFFEKHLWKRMQLLKLHSIMNQLKCQFSKHEQEGNFFDGKQVNQSILEMNEALKNVAEESESEFIQVLIAKCPTSMPVSQKHLADKLERLEERIWPVSLADPENGFIGILISHFFSSFLNTVPEIKPSTTSPALLIKEAKHYLENEESVEKALDRINQMKGWSGMLARDWKEEARDVLKMQMYFQIVDTYLGMKTLL